MKRQRERNKVKAKSTESDYNRERLEALSSEAD